MVASATITAISPDGRLLAVNGARDRVLRIVDLDRFELAASASLERMA
ncbi:hypothetical protein WMF31_20460 [Sorangium sp. So ce1036]